MVFRWEEAPYIIGKPIPLQQLTAFHLLLGSIFAEFRVQQNLAAGGRDIIPRAIVLQKLVHRL